MSKTPHPGTGPTPTVRPSSGLASALERNIKALADQRQSEQEHATASDRVAQWISKFAGSMSFVAVHAALVIAWIAVNTGITPVAPFDPSFVILATVASVEAIFLSTFILISQNRAAITADRRADLDLQVGLLAEHEVTHLIKLTTRIAQRLGIEEAANPELAELKRTVAPEVVLDRLKDINNDQP